MRRFHCALMLKTAVRHAISATAVASLMHIKLPSPQPSLKLIWIKVISRARATVIGYRLRDCGLLSGRS